MRRPILRLRNRRRNVAAAAASAGAACVALTLALLPAGAPAAGFQRPPIRHVFVIMLENENYATTFGDPSADPYLASTLPKEGALLTDYYATGHESNDNYISIVSGQPPNPENQPTARCSTTSSARTCCRTASNPAPVAYTRRALGTSVPSCLRPD
jgi:hypothetical protein